MKPSKLKIIASYSIFLGISVMALWGMILLTEEGPEGPVEMTFHLTSEFLMALVIIKLQTFSIDDLSWDTAPSCNII